MRYEIYRYTTAAEKHRTNEDYVTVMGMVPGRREAAELAVQYQRETGLDHFVRVDC